MKPTFFKFRLQLFDPKYFNEGLTGPKHFDQMLSWLPHPLFSFASFFRFNLNGIKLTAFSFIQCSNMRAVFAMLEHVRVSQHLLRLKMIECEMFLQAWVQGSARCKCGESVGARWQISSFSKLPSNRTCRWSILWCSSHCQCHC